MFLYVTYAYRMFLYYLHNIYTIKEVLLSNCYKDNK